MEISGALNQYVNICRDTFNGYYRKIKQKYEICCGHTKKNKLHTACTLWESLRAVLQADFFLNKFDCYGVSGIAEVF